MWYISYKIIKLKQCGGNDLMHFWYDMSCVSNITFFLRKSVYIYLFLVLFVFPKNPVTNVLNLNPWQIIAIVYKFYNNLFFHEKKRSNSIQISWSWHWIPLIILYSLYNEFWGSTPFIFLHGQYLTLSHAYITNYQVWK